jgi:glycine cleavage system H protein
MKVPANLKYTQDHEWARMEGAEAVVGVTDYAQSQLGDVVYIELPKVGEVVARGDVIGTIEAVKTVADIFSPVSGEIIAVNDVLKDASELVNKIPLEKAGSPVLNSPIPAKRIPCSARPSTKN